MFDLQRTSLTFAVAALVCRGLWSCSWRSEQTLTPRQVTAFCRINCISHVPVTTCPTCMWHSGRCHHLLRRQTLLPPELTVLIRQLSVKSRQCTHHLRTYGSVQEVCCWWRDRAFHSAPNCPTSSEVTTAPSVLKQLVHEAETAAISHQPHTNE